MISFDEELLQLLSGLPEKFGTIRDQHLANNASKFLLIFQDTPENWSIRWSIGESLCCFPDFDLFFMDGSSGQIDTAIAYAIPKAEIRSKVVTYFLWKLFISPAEYAHIMRGGHFESIQLFGVEDRILYKKAQKILTNQIKFLPQQIKRAQAITKNIIEKMVYLKTPIAALTCAGDIPDLVSEELEWFRVSYAVIRPKIYYPSDKKLYAERITKKMPKYREIIGNMTEPPEIPISIDRNSPYIKEEELKEQFRKKLIELIENHQLLYIFEDVISPRKYKKLKKILHLKQYGPKTKAVLIKTELLSLPQGYKYFQKILMFNSDLKHANDAADREDWDSAIEWLEQAMSKAGQLNFEQIKQNLSLFYNNRAVKTINRFTEELNKSVQQKNKIIKVLFRQMAKKSHRGKFCGLCGISTSSSFGESWLTFEEGKNKSLLCSNCANKFQEAMKTIQNIKIEDKERLLIHAARGDLLRAIEIDKNNQTAKRSMEDLKKIYDKHGESFPSNLIAQKAAKSIRKKTTS